MVVMMGITSLVVFVVMFGAVVFLVMPGTVMMTITPWGGVFFIVPAVPVGVMAVYLFATNQFFVRRIGISGSWPHTLWDSACK